MPIAPSTAVPNRGTRESSLDEWNRELRASDTYLNFMRDHGLSTDGRVKLSRAQQSALENRLRAAGTPVPGGMHIDQGGNLNQKNRLVRNAAITAGVLAGGYFAAPAIMGAMGAAGGAGAAGAGAATLPAAATAGIGFSAAPAIGAAAGTAAGSTAMTASTAKWLIPALMDAGGKGISAVGNSRASRAAREAEERNSAARLAHERDLALIDDRLARDKLSLDESELDPFRDLLAQLAAAERFDRLANTQPLNIDFSNARPGSFRPTVTGGAMNYAPTDELRTAANTARTTALSGGGSNRPVIDSAKAREALNLLSGSGRQPISSTMPVGGRPSILPQDPAIDPLGMDYGRSARALSPTDEDLALSDPSSLTSPRLGRPIRRRRASALAA